MAEVRGGSANELAASRRFAPPSHKRQGTCEYPVILFSTDTIAYRMEHHQCLLCKQSGTPLRFPLEQRAFDDASRIGHQQPHQPDDQAQRNDGEAQEKIV